MRDTEEFESIHRELNAVADIEDTCAMLINFSGVEFFSSRMIGLLVALHSKLSDRGGKLVLCRLRPEPFRVLMLSKIDTLIPVFDTEEDALNALTASKT